MKIALIGYGKMGKEIEAICLEKGYEISVIIGKNEQKLFATNEFKGVDVAIEFTNPQSAVDNYIKCFENNIPVISGTTGWLDRRKEIDEICKKNNGGFFYASNFSIGMNILFRLNDILARMTNFKGYKVSIEETHHKHKLDAPSGTAISLAEGIIKNREDLDGWELVNDNTKNNIIPITAIREGEVFGIHKVKHISVNDEIEISHKAFSRKCFATGVVTAAEFMYKNPIGIYSMENLFNTK